ncbi:Aldehyde/histidinol dehydrogenase [Sesbania bispinosa]|nr:Aldehyde/histidinol dehydrogenase [Sesbania bispinosa]
MAGTGLFAEILEGDVYKYYADGEWRNLLLGKLLLSSTPLPERLNTKFKEVNKVIDAAKSAQKSWAKTPLWKRAELLHKAAAILKEHKAEIAECLVKEIAKPAKDAVTEVVRSGDLVSYCAEEG